MSVVVVNLSESKPFVLNYFEFFGLPKQYKVDLQALSQAYLRVQQEVHPDKHASAADSERRQSMQLATFANTAYQTLKNPLKRGFYLCELDGLDAQLETNTAMPRSFLMQQMEWRELMDEVRGDAHALEALQDEVQKSLNLKIIEVEQDFDTNHQSQDALEKLRSALFLEKFLQELDHRLELLV